MELGETDEDALAILVQQLQNNEQRQGIMDTLQTFLDNTDPEEEIAVDMELYLERLQELSEDAAQLDTDAELDRAMQLINAYCIEEFDQEADYSNFNHVDLAYSATSDSEHTVEIYADLIAFKLVYTVDGETVREVDCESLTELNEYLADLDFDSMVADAEEAFALGQQEQESPVQETELPAEEEQPAALAPPKPKRERVVFSTLHPEIPEEEIAYIHDANTEARKKELFARVRSGQVRVLIGSTQKMGAGTNVQDRLIALHDLDCPWRPSDVGRILRTFKIKTNVEVTDNGKDDF